MRPGVLALVVLLSCASPSAPVQSPPAPATARDRLDDVRAVLAGYAALSAAFARRDVDAILAVRSPTFAADYPDGRHDDTAGAAEGLREWMPLNHPPVGVSYSILAVDEATPDRIALQIFQRSNRYQDLAGKRRRIDHDVTQRETWIRTPAGWRHDHVDQIRDRHRWVDGIAVNPERPFDPNAPPYVPGP